MLEVDQLTYTAIITINLPGTDQPATASITLTPQDAIPTGSGKVKLLRDCTLADLNEFAESLEAEVWAAHRERLLTDLATDDASHVKITILNETGQPLSTSAENWLAHAVILSGIDTVPGEMDAGTEEMPEEETLDAPLDEVEDIPVFSETEQIEFAEPDTLAVGPVAEEEPAGESGPEIQPTKPAAPADETASTAAVVPASVAAELGESVEEEAEPAADVAETLPSGPQVELKTAKEPAEVPVIASEKKPDIRIAGLRRPLGHSTSAAVDILFNEPSFRDAQAHALSSLDREVAGVLVGPMPEKQPDGRYVVHVTDMIIAKHTKMHGASVTYTPESWRYIHDRLGERYPHEEALIVGWYHTHPGFGIFLSGMDLFIHQNFFTQIWHVALVLDPVARRSGFFCWNRGQTEVQKYDFPWPEWLAGSW